MNGRTHARYVNPFFFLRRESNINIPNLWTETNPRSDICLDLEGGVTAFTSLDTVDYAGATAGYMNPSTITIRLPDGACYTYVYTPVDINYIGCL